MTVGDQGLSGLCGLHQVSPNPKVISGSKGSRPEPAANKRKHQV